MCRLSSTVLVHTLIRSGGTHAILNISSPPCTHPQAVAEPVTTRDKDQSEPVITHAIPNASSPPCTHLHAVAEPPTTRNKDKSESVSLQLEPNSNTYNTVRNGRCFESPPTGSLWTPTPITV